MSSPTKHSTIDTRRRDQKRMTGGGTADLVRAYVIAVLRRNGSSEVAIHGDTRLTADLGLDSLAMMELIFCLEDRFALSIPLEAVARICDVDDLVEELKWHLQHRQKAAA